MVPSGPRPRMGKVNAWPLIVSATSNGSSAVPTTPSSPPGSPMVASRSDTTRGEPSGAPFATIRRALKNWFRNPTSPGITRSPGMLAPDSSGKSLSLAPPRSTSSIIGTMPTDPSPGRPKPVRPISLVDGIGTGMLSLSKMTGKSKLRSVVSVAMAIVKLKPVKSSSPKRIPRWRISSKVRGRVVTWVMRI